MAASALCNASEMLPVRVPRNIFESISVLFRKQVDQFLLFYFHILFLGAEIKKHFNFFYLILEKNARARVFN